MKKISLVLLTIGLLILTVGVAVFSKTQPQKGETKITVVASFYPLAEFTRQVAGDHVQVITVVPNGVEPHDFEPSPQRIAQIYDAELFVFNGGGFDPWAETITDELINNGVKVIEMADQFELLKVSGEEMVEEDEADDDHGAFDPHIWLDPVLVQSEIVLIRDGLIAIDPVHKADYEENAVVYMAKLVALDRAFVEGLKDCAIRDVVTTHAAFGYLAKRYNIQMTPISGLSPEAEPSPKQIAQVAEFAREHKINYIFFETLVSPAVAQTIADEVGAAILVFNPLEGLTEAEMAAGQDYISVMESNLDNLRIALACQ